MSSWHAFLKLAMHDGFPAGHPFQPARALCPLSLTVFLREASRMSHAVELGRSCFSAFGSSGSIANIRFRTVKDRLIGHLIDAVVFK